MRLNPESLPLSGVRAMLAGLLLATCLELAAGEVREPAVSGLFYPATKQELSAALDQLLASAKTAPSPGKLRALICPHAGYAYSGPIAAKAYSLLSPDSFDTVVLLAPSHTAELRKAAVSDASAYRTPLGDMTCSPKAAELAKHAPFALQPRCSVQRPGWWEQAGKIAPMPHRDRADTWEHSGEVQVPFLQKTLPKAELVSVVMGDVDPVTAAKALDMVIGEKTLLVASSDLSHYRSYAQACEIDKATVDAICRMDPEAFGPEQACGYVPVQTLLHLAKTRGWRPVLLDLRNSGDTAGGKDRVVGYAAIAFYEGGGVKAPEKEPQARYTPEERRYLLQLARTALTSVVMTGKLPAPELNQVPDGLRIDRGCFVTLTVKGMLRGCIGHILAQEPLYKAVIDNVRNAALEDPRFDPVTKDELAAIEIEVSVLSAPLPLFYSDPADLLRRLRPGRDGVVLQIGRASATYLPQVWEQLPDKEQFMNSLSMKAGCPAGAWRNPGTRVYVYQDEAFKEKRGE